MDDPRLLQHFRHLPFLKKYQAYLNSRPRGVRYEHLPFSFDLDGAQYCVDCYGNNQIFIYADPTHQYTPAARFTVPESPATAILEALENVAMSVDDTCERFLESLPDSFEDYAIPGKFTISLSNNSVIPRRERSPFSNSSPAIPSQTLRMASSGQEALPKATATSKKASS